MRGVRTVSIRKVTKTRDMTGTPVRQWLGGLSWSPLILSSPDPDPALLVPPQHAPSLLSLPPPLHPGPLFLIV